MTLKSSARLAMFGAVFVVVTGIFLRPLLPIDETRYLAVAWEMHLNGNWLVPTKNFDLYPDKPPLLFWLMNLVWAVTGVSEAAARLIGPGFALLTIWLTSLLARDLWPEDRDAGSRAVLALTGLLLFVFYGGLTLFDAMLSAATVAALLSARRALATGAWRWWAALGASIAVGVLSKGPVILIHVAPALLVLRFWRAPAHPDAPRTALVEAGLALAVATAMIGFWLGPALALGGPEYRQAVLWTQSAGRITSSFAHAEPWWFFLVHLPLIVFPWILVPGLWRRAMRQDWTEAGLLLCAVWAGSALVLFSLISGKQTHYLIPELPALALIVARLSRDMRVSLTWPVGLIALVVLAGAAAGLGLVPLGELAGALDPAGSLLVWAALAALLLAVAWRINGLRGGALLSLGLVASINLLTAITAAGSMFSTHPMAEALAEEQADAVAFFGRVYHAEFNFAGRMTEAVATPDDLADLELWSRENPEGVIIARPDKDDLPWPAERELRYRDALYGIWKVADAPTPNW